MEIAKPIQTVAQQMSPVDIEVGSGYVEGMAFVLEQEVIQDIGHCMLLVVDDERDVHNLVLLISKNATFAFIAIHTSKICCILHCNVWKMVGYFRNPSCSYNAL